MNVFTLDNNQYVWKVKDHKKDDNLCSSYHLKARKILKQLFPASIVAEEVPFKIYDNKTLFFDFYIPLYHIAIEVQGQQHYKFSYWLHKHKLNFIERQKRDKQKEEWCSINNIKLIILPYTEKEDEWIKRICETTD